MQPTENNGPLPPPGFDIQIEAPVAASGAMPLFPPSPHSGELNGGNGSGFDYFTSSMPSPTQTSPSRAWAVGLPSAMPSAMGNAPRVIINPLPQVQLPAQHAQHAQQQTVQPAGVQNTTANNHLPIIRPQGTTRPPNSTATATNNVAGSHRPSGAHTNGFKLNPQEVAARKSKLSAIEAELKAILNGNEPEEDVGNASTYTGGAMPMPAGFQRAGQALGVDNAVPVASAVMPPAVGPLGPQAPMGTTAAAAQPMMQQAHNPSLPAAPEMNKVIAGSSQDRKRSREEDTLKNSDDHDSRAEVSNKLRRSIEDSISTHQTNTPHVAGPSAPLSEQTVPNFAFITGTGKTVTVNSKGLEAAKRLLQTPAGEKGKEPAENATDIGEKQWNETKRPLPPQARLFGETPTMEDTDKERERQHPLPIPNESGFMGFQTGLGNKVSVSDASLAVARRKMAEVEAEPPLEKDTTTSSDCGDANIININNNEVDDDGFLLRNPPHEVKDTSHSSAVPKFAGFSTGNGINVSVPESKLAAARKLIEVPGEENEARTPGPSRGVVIAMPESVNDASDRDTPALRKQVLRSTLSSTTPGTTPGSLKTSAVPPHRLSRFGAQAGAGGAVVVGISNNNNNNSSDSAMTNGGQGHMNALISKHPGPTTVTGSTARKGRGKFTTPRPIAPKRPLAVQGDTTPITASGPQQQLISTPLHDLTSSALKAARVEALIMSNTHGHPQVQGQGPYSRQPWPSYLPLDSLHAAEYAFTGDNGAQIGWENLRQDLLNAGANPLYATEEWVR